ncbi:MAG: M14 family zinc carboxypeptidase [Candidatus Poseidoniales archaeon]|jgi:hypothetical protein|nr:M14 family zinc carboxypeptidase [Candidatus Poseidoniales archaeon]
MSRSFVARAIIVLLLSTSLNSIITAQQPEPVQEHWYHTYPTLTEDIQSWEENYPDIVKIVSAGETLYGRQQWVVQISDWTMENKSNGEPKEIVYIDGGHHGNEHLGTELAFLTAEYYIEGWGNNLEDAIRVLENTEIHVMIMLNADGNDVDSRWNMNQVDLNRNYDHHWSTEESASGDGPFSEPETSNNAAYMEEWVSDADLYVTMHTGTWILAYPWGFTPNMPSDYELFEFIRDDIHEKIDSELPIKNANSGIYPTHGTSRDYGYGIMGYPTFTFETDDEQFLLGTIETISSRLSTELDVMKYLIENIWYWRARLEVQSMKIQDNEIEIDVVNLGRASTSNASLHYVDKMGKVLWHSENFGVNATNTSKIILGIENLSIDSEGIWELHYQKRVIDSSLWVNELILEKPIITSGDSTFLPAPGFLVCILAIAIASLKNKKNIEKEPLE